MTRTEAATHSYIITYGSKGTFTLRNSRIKKGSGKGGTRLQNVTALSKNSIDKLTWCV